jgi:hypothetical protein
MIKESYVDEYAPAEPTIMLKPRMEQATGALATSPAWLPADIRPLLGLGLIVIGLVAAGIAWRSAIFAAGFSAGWAAGHAAGALQPWIDARGWIVLLFIAIGVPSLLIYRDSRIRHSGTWESIETRM